jgi:hypothetical protein
MSERTPNFVTNEPIDINYGKYDTKVIPVGSFVRPIEYQYVPKHILDDKRWERFDKETEIFVFTRYGFVPVKRTSIRETM